jgi:hypothetical protein
VKRYLNLVFTCLVITLSSLTLTPAYATNITCIKTDYGLLFGPISGPSIGGSLSIEFPGRSVIWHRLNKGKGAWKLDKAVFERRSSKSGSTTTQGTFDLYIGRLGDKLEPTLVIEAAPDSCWPFLVKTLLENYPLSSFGVGAK